jgi:alginate O-acetyltransferase complex protein AlgI
MLFNSLAFLFAFLPIAVAGFFLLARLSHTAAAAWLALASLFFYGWWNPAYVALLVASITFNYVSGISIGRAAEPQRKRLLVGALAVNLLVLGYFKYANFFLQSANSVLGTQASAGAIILPLGISFFTFTQIAYLVDTYYGKVKEYRFIHYGLFVTYFPHLIAGPVLHHGEMMPQFGRQEIYRPAYGLIAAGLTLFVLGLFKKVMVADEIGGYATPIFQAASSGVALSLLEGWCGALAYTFQLYFDFSGYSDMAIGLSLLFGVRLPVNFHSPYKAVNIIDFWRRWHITLSRFLRDYLYIPLGGNRKGPGRRYINLIVTMLLGGLWHGAGWTFVLWGGLHGIYLGINHGWHALRQRLGHDRARSSGMGRAVARLITFAAVAVAWVIFRAENLPAAATMLKAMAGWNGVTLPDFWLVKWGAAGAWAAAHGVTFLDSRGLVTTGLVYWIVILLAVVWLAPNTQQIMQRCRPALGVPSERPGSAWLIWRPTTLSALAVSALALIAIVNLHKQSEFLYFQF